MKNEIAVIIRKKASWSFLWTYNEALGKAMSSHSSLRRHKSLFGQWKRSPEATSMKDACLKRISLGLNLSSLHSWLERSLCLSLKYLMENKNMYFTKKFIPHYHLSKKQEYVYTYVYVLIKEWIVQKKDRKITERNPWFSLTIH